MALLWTLEMQRWLKLIKSFAVKFVKISDLKNLFGKIAEKHHAGEYNHHLN